MPAWKSAASNPFLKSLSQFLLHRRHAIAKQAVVLEICPLGEQGPGGRHFKLGNRGLNPSANQSAMHRVSLGGWLRL